MLEARRLLVLIAAMLGALDQPAGFLPVRLSALVADDRPEAQRAV
jgi:hypothetical protein